MGMEIVFPSKEAEIIPAPSLREDIIPEGEILTKSSGTVHLPKRVRSAFSPVFKVPVSKTWE